MCSRGRHHTYVLLSVLVVLVGSVTTSKKSGAESEATSDLERLTD